MGLQTESKERSFPLLQNKIYPLRFLGSCMSKCMENAALLWNREVKLPVDNGEDSSLSVDSNA